MMASLRLPIRRHFLFFLQKRLHYVADNFIPDIFYYVQCLLWLIGPQSKKCVSLCIGHTVTNNSVENLIIGFGKCPSHRAIPIEHCVSAYSLLTVQTSQTHYGYVSSTLEDTLRTRLSTLYLRSQAHVP